MAELGLNAFQTAKKAGLGDSFVRDILRGRARSPSSENLLKLASALETDIGWLLYVDRDAVPASPKQDFVLNDKINTLKVIGVIQAGNFKDITMVDNETISEEIQIPSDNRFSKTIQYALKIEGDSMNLKFPDGTYVAVIGLIESGIELKPGMTVHVERTMGGGQYVETTLKEIQSINGKTELIPRSTNPIHKPLVIEGGEDMEVQIKGVVIGSYRPEVF